MPQKNVIGPVFYPMIATYANDTAVLTSNQNSVSASQILQTSLDAISRDKKSDGNVTVVSAIKRTCYVIWNILTYIILVTVKTYFYLIF